jgi:hypothetical protein
MELLNSLVRPGESISGTLLSSSKTLVGECFAIGLSAVSRTSREQEEMDDDDVDEVDDVGWWEG